MKNNKNKIYLTYKMINRKSKIGNNVCVVVQHQTMKHKNLISQEKAKTN